jgi:cellulase/cellobiase CelA1
MNCHRPGLVAVVCELWLAASSSVALAHHSAAMFDPSKTVVIKGTIVDFNWTNPHSSFKVIVLNRDGTRSTWAVEMNGPGNLVPLGWTRTTIKAGDMVTVSVRPLRDGAPGGQYVSIVLPDGKMLGEKKRPAEK